MPRGGGAPLPPPPPKGGTPPPPPPPFISEKSSSFVPFSLPLQHSLTEYDIIKVVNYVRSSVRSGQDPRPTLAAVRSGSTAQPWDKDEYLIPVLPEDPLLFADLGQSVDEVVPDGTHEAEGLTLDPHQLRDQVLHLTVANKTLQETLQSLLTRSELHQQLRDDDADDQNATRSNDDDDDQSLSSRRGPPINTMDRIDKAYFGSYSGFAIHREMLGDHVRTETYRRALENNPAQIKGAVVLDVGCGTGVLSMFAARAGAAHVIAIDGSERIARFARANIARNGLSDKITVVTGRVEDLTDLPFPPGVQKVDVIVSEWMGYALTFECMLDTVLVARDRWLAPGGAVLPDTATFLLAGGGPGSHGLNFWDDVYGLSMQPMREEEEGEARSNASVRVVKSEDIVTSSVRAHEFDITTMTPSDADFTTEFVLTLVDEGKGEEADVVRVESLVLWFETGFTRRFCPSDAVVLDTSPHETATHWAQTVLYLPKPLVGRPGDKVTGVLSVSAGKQEKRGLDITVQCRCNTEEVVQASYVMNIVD